MSENLILPNMLSAIAEAILPVGRPAQTQGEETSEAVRGEAGPPVDRDR